MRLRVSILAIVAVAGCTATGTAETTAPANRPTDPTTTATTPVSTTTATETTLTTSTTTTTPATTTTSTLPPGVTQPPEWLGNRPLPLDDNDNPIVPDEVPTEMVDRRFTTPILSIDDRPETFDATIDEIPDEVLNRSTWEPDCPVGVDDLRYLTIPFRGFEGQPHRGEMIVNADVADEIVGVFETLWDAGYPIEEMRITSPAEIEAPATGDGNNTESFVCRNATGGSNWSEHAFGLAIDINPFHNPYLRGDILIPELAGAYLDREWIRPGMIVEGDVVTAAFDAIGWGWGGRWSSLLDWQHFSRSGN